METAKLGKVEHAMWDAISTLDGTRRVEAVHAAVCAMQIACHDAYTEEAADTVVEVVEQMLTAVKQHRAGVIASKDKRAFDAKSWLDKRNHTFANLRERIENLDK